MWLEFKRVLFRSSYVLFCRVKCTGWPGPDPSESLFILIDSSIVKSIYFVFNALTSIAIVYLDLKIKEIPKQSSIIENINLYNSIQKKDDKGDNNITINEKPFTYKNILFKRLEIYLTKTQAWQNPELSITMLASELGTNRNTLLQCIKENGFDNYVYYINRIRIEHFIKIIKDKEIDSYQDAFYEVGFRSRATAIRNFKNLTGMTPSDYFYKYFKEIEERDSEK